MTHFLSKILKWGELAGIVITLAAIILKVMNFPGASGLFMIGLITLACVFFASGFLLQSLITRENKFHTTNLVVNKLQQLLYIGISVLLVGYLFAILLLKGANEMMLIGLFTSFGCIIISFVLILIRRENLTPLKSPLLKSIIVLTFYFLTPYLR